MTQRSMRDRGNKRCAVLRAVWAAASLLLMEPAAQAAFRDPLDAPSAKVQQPQASPINGMTRAGSRLVGVGARGVIIVSDDEGGRWRQVDSPVQSDLTAVHFATPQKGWAVGHDGVILHSADGGLTWARQFDGRQAAEQFKADYARRKATGEVSAADVKQMELNYQAGPSLPFLDVWFDNELVGWAVGSFGSIAATADGGRSWQAWMHRIDNPGYLNLNAIRAAGGDVFIAGEQGMVYRLDRAARRFVPLATGYKGSFFGVGGTRDMLLAYGLRGTVYRSTDRGATWSALPAILPVTVTGAAFVDDKHVLLTNVAGMLLSSDDAGLSFRPLAATNGPLLNGVLPAAGQRLITFGVRGANVVAIPEAKP